MKKLTVVFLLACTFMTGCAGGTSTPTPDSSAKAEEPAARTPEPEPSEPVTPDPAPAPAETEGAAILAALAQIDARLAADPERVLRRLDNICLDIQQGKDEATVVASAESRLEGGDIPDLTPEQAQLIVGAARELHCS